MPAVGNITTIATQDERKKVGTASLAVLTVDVAPVVLVRGCRRRHCSNNRKRASEIVLIGLRTSASLPLDTAEVAKRMLTATAIDVSVEL
jgi:hypothetical protein